RGHRGNPIQESAAPGADYARTTPRRRRRPAPFGTGRLVTHARHSRTRSAQAQGSGAQHPAHGGLDRGDDALAGRADLLSGEGRLGGAELHGVGEGLLPLTDLLAGEDVEEL